jgi:hypothetical protein
MKKITKILTGFRLDPSLKALAQKAAAQEYRSLSNYLEMLIRQDVQARGLLNRPESAKK